MVFAFMSNLIARATLNIEKQPLEQKCIECYQQYQLVLTLLGWSWQQNST